VGEAYRGECWQHLGSGPRQLWRGTGAQGGWLRRSGSRLTSSRPCEGFVFVGTVNACFALVWRLWCRMVPCVVLPCEQRVALSCPVLLCVCCGRNPSCVSGVECVPVASLVRVPIACPVCVPIACPVCVPIACPVCVPIACLVCVLWKESLDATACCRVASSCPVSSVLSYFHPRESARGGGGLSECLV